MENFESGELNWAYLLRCQNGSLYAGWTNDLGRRMFAHTHARGAKYTRAFGGKQLAYARRFDSKHEAMQHEAALKKLTKAQKEALCSQFAAKITPRLSFAQTQDAEEILQIYEWYVKNSTFTLRCDPPVGASPLSWLQTAWNTAPVVLARDADGRLMGFALAHPWRDGAGGYRWNVETTIYCAPDCRAFRVGEPLYRTLIEVLQQMGYWNAYAVLTDPNPASEAFHAKNGYLCQGRSPRCGYKLGRWLGVSTWWRTLHNGRGCPAPAQALSDAQLAKILAAQQPPLPGSAPGEAAERRAAPRRPARKGRAAKPAVKPAAKPD